MCGLIGFVGTSVSEARFHTGMVAIETRGGHAWGYSCFDSNKKLIVRKSAGTVREVLLGLPDGLVTNIIGHTRFATHGSLENVNNHPHIGGGLALSHNGVVSNTHAAQRGDCDSEAILKMCIEAGLGVAGSLPVACEILARVCAKISGSFRLLIHIALYPGQIFVACDTLDPLYIGYEENCNVWLASEAGQLPENTMKARLLGNTVYAIGLYGFLHSESFTRSVEIGYKSYDWRSYYGESGQTGSAFAMYCDECGGETSILKAFKSYDLCNDCYYDAKYPIMKKSKKVDVLGESCVYCGSSMQLSEFDGDTICIQCLADIEYLPDQVKS